MPSAKCVNCNEKESKHCKECNACPEQHAGWCSKEPGNIEHAKRQNH